MINEEVLKREQEEIRREQLEHRDVLLAISAIIKTKEGQQLFSYLFKNFEATSLPDRSMEGSTLHEYLGFLRAGNSIYKLACEADSETAASLIAKLERKRYEYLYEQHRTENA
jgi:hypothetical protein